MRAHPAGNSIFNPPEKKNTVENIKKFLDANQHKKIKVEKIYFNQHTLVVGVKNSCCCSLY